MVLSSIDLIITFHKLMCKGLRNSLSQEYWMVSLLPNILRPNNTVSFLRNTHNRHPVSRRNQERREASFEFKTRSMFYFVVCHRLCHEQHQLIASDVYADIVF